MSGTRYFLIVRLRVGSLLYINGQQMEDCPFVSNCLLLTLPSSLNPTTERASHTPVSFVAYYSVHMQGCAELERTSSWELIVCVSSQLCIQ